MAKKDWKFEPLCEKKRTLILDTDIGPDCDDVGAIAILAEYHRMHGFDVAGVVNCTSNPYGNGAIRALGRFLGLDLTVAQNEHPGLLEDAQVYNRPVSEKYLAPAERSAALPALEFYRDALEKAADDSVVLVTIGQFTTVSALLEKYPDLVAKKVYAMVSMACAFPSGREFNIFGDTPAAQNVFANFPRPIICSGFDVGLTVMTGYAEAPENAERNPVYDSYRLYLHEQLRDEGTLWRPSFDLTAVQYAVEGDGDFYALSEPLAIEIAEDGSNASRPWDGSGAVCYSILRKTPDEPLAAHLNRLLHISDKS